MGPRKNNGYGATAASVKPLNSNLEAPPNFQEETITPNKINVVVNNLEGNSSNSLMSFVPNNGASAPRINNSRNNTLVGGRRRKKRSRKSKKTRKNRR
jgi:hypothetical protein